MCSICSPSFLTSTNRVRLGHEDPEHYVVSAMHTKPFRNQNQGPLHWHQICLYFLQMCEITLASQRKMQYLHPNSHKRSGMLVVLLETGVGREGQPRDWERQQWSQCLPGLGTAPPAATPPCLAYAPSEPLQDHPPAWGTNWDPAIATNCVWAPQQLPGWLQPVSWSNLESPSHAASTFSHKPKFLV